MSAQEYAARVGPLMADPHMEWQRRQASTLLENLLDAQRRLDRIDSHLEELEQDFRDWQNENIDDEQEEVLVRLGDNLDTVVQEAEEMFVAFPMAAVSSAADEFLYEKVLQKHWERYVREGKFRKIRMRLGLFIKRTKELLRGIHNEIGKLSDFLAQETSSLPAELQGDFDLARDLHSVGMDEASAFFAGRGLEGVLRAVALRLRAQVQEKNRLVPLHEMDFADLGEGFRRLKWKRSGQALIDRELKSLIDLLRTARNATAHPRSFRTQSVFRAGWQEIAKLTAAAAAELWTDSSGGRRKLTATTINRDW